MNKKRTPKSGEISKLFSNNDPDEVWARAVDVIMHINPAHDYSHVRTTFNDVVRLYRGEYPAYAAIATPYHDLSHTLSVFICAIRLMHGVHVSGMPLTEPEITSVMTAALLHDVGYAQLRGSAAGTGAQYTRTHVSRGIHFMQCYTSERNFPPDLVSALEFLLQSTDHQKGFANIDFPDERTRMLGQILGTADLVGQMADRFYLEKLIFLYFEFKESNMGDYKSTHDLMRRSLTFLDHTLRRLDGELGGMVEKFPQHFKVWLGVERNYYVESIEKNMAYLTDVIAQGENGFTAKLRRGQIVSRVYNSLARIAEMQSAERPAEIRPPEALV